MMDNLAQVARLDWDQIFEPAGYSLSYAQLSLTHKNEVSMRRKALEQMHEYVTRVELASR